ncbi:MAG: hypothetical protein DRP42_02130 [Tenericutes bacterium]|nr:MAG: hypothetical protein DRP42_02130 [Mycoplasmatota bacterium]
MIEGFLNDSIDKELETLMDNVLYVGSDEVGVGENIGPIVVCVLSFENLDNKFKALKLSIKDSKKMSAKSVTATAKKIKEISNVQCRVFTPVEFNDMYKKMPNVKKINAMIQKQLHDKFGYSKESPHISDGFVSQKNFDNYLTSVGMVNEGIILEPGGEDKYIEVAAAAIVAKDLYNS